MSLPDVPPPSLARPVDAPAARRDEARDTEAELLDGDGAEPTRH
jgi:hypothetical protein